MILCATKLSGCCSSVDPVGGLLLVYVVYCVVCVSVIVYV